MTGKRSTITLDADEYLRLLNELINLENRLRSVGLAGFNSGKTTKPQRYAAKEKEDDTDLMEIDLDMSGIEWKLSNRDGGGLAGPDAGWCWAFSTTRDGGIRREAVQLVAALEQYGKVLVDGFVISLAGRDGKLLNRKKLKR